MEDESKNRNINKEHSETFMEKVASFIIDKRKAFYVIFIIACIYCAISIPKTEVNNDLSVYLPKTTETRIGVDIMEKEFTTYASAEVMISNITYNKAKRFVDQISNMEDVMMVTFDNTPDHYINSTALLMVSFRGEQDKPEVVSAMDSIREMLEDYDVSYNSEVGYDFSKTLVKEMSVILAIAAGVIAIVLLITSKTYLELVVFLIVFGVSAILNMGTNFLLGEISFVTNAIAIILQLALAVDYAIIMCHRYMEEHQNLPAREADIVALSKAIVEISSSSLTTISGLLALTTMQYKIGLDMGIVLIKGIVCSLLTVFLLMPGLLMMFNKGMDKTRHRNFVPNVSAWGRFVIKIRYFLLPVFALALVGGVYLSNQTDYVFSMTVIDTDHPSVQRIAQDKIKDTFGIKNTVAIVVPKDDYESEKKILDRVGELPEIVGALGLANIEVDDTHVLTDKMTPRQFSELAEIDVELARLLYSAYGVEKEEYGSILQDIDKYQVPLINVFRFLLEQRDKGVVNLNDEQNDKIDELNEQLQDGLVQLEGENNSRLVFTANVADEGQKTIKLLDNMRSIAEQYYNDDEVILVSNATLAKDLKSSFTNDNLKISILTALFVMIILLFTFKSIGLPFLLIMTIQGSIFINFSFPVITSTNLFFLSYLIVSAIQMGATIDYAILLTNRYQALKPELCSNKRAIAEAVNQSFPTVFTSGTIMTVAGFLISFMSTEPIVNSIGLALGRGTLISIILVMTVLPQILYTSDKLIEKSALTLKINGIQRVTADDIKVNGRVRGMVDGFVDGEFNGVIRGSLNAHISSNSMLSTDNKEELTDKDDTKNLKSDDVESENE